MPHRLSEVDDIIRGIPVVVGYRSTRYLEPGVEYQGRRARRQYNDRQDRSALQQPQRRTTSAVQRAFGRREITCAPAIIIV